MRKVSALLSRFANLEAPRKLIEREFAAAIKEIFGGKNIDFAVSYRKPDLIIKTASSVFKNELFLKKDKILEKLAERLGKSSPRKIFFK